MDDVIVIKQVPPGVEKWRYSGRVVESGDTWVKIEAFFNRDDLPFHGMVFARGDRFVETYYSDRWFNIFEIYDGRSENLKGWYCNVTQPAEFRDGVITYVDLALDLLVFLDGRQLVLDEDEFEVLNLDSAQRACALQALQQLQAQFSGGFR